MGHVSATTALGHRQIDSKSRDLDHDTMRQLPYEVVRSRQGTLAEQEWEQQSAAIQAAKQSRFAQTAAQRDLVAEISRILFEADPIGINFESNTDECDAEAETIVIALPRARDADDVRALTYEAFVQWFDPETAGPIERYRTTSAEIWRAWQRHQGPAALSARETATAPSRGSAPSQRRWRERLKARRSPT